MAMRFDSHKSSLEQVSSPWSSKLSSIGAGMRSCPNLQPPTQLTSSLPGTEESGSLLPVSVGPAAEETCP